MKIGVFDSGLGGLTVVQAMRNIIKGAEIHYIADTKNAPYGEKTQAQILQYSLSITEHFIKEHQVDALIIACNTATSAAVHTLRKNYPELIIIGTEPGIKPAIEQTVTGRVGVLATPATLKSEKYQQLANRLSSQKNILLVEQACPGLVEQIEKGEVETPKTKKMLEAWLAPMRDVGVDTIVLGCTHYPLASKVIKEVMQREVRLIDTGDAIARRLWLLGREKGCFSGKRRDIRLYATGEIHSESVAKLMDNAISVAYVEIAGSGE